MICNQPQDDAPGSTAIIPTAEDWFQSGRRVPYDPNHKKIVPAATNNTLNIFEKVVWNDNNNNNNSADDLWLTCLPSFPDGSYGFAKLERALTTAYNTNNTTSTSRTTRSRSAHHHPSTTESQVLQLLPHRLYVEYVGQGDCDKPADYSYSARERADLVQAVWAAHGVRRTVVVAVGYSATVLMELLRRQQEEELQRGGPAAAVPRIVHVLCINGALYADGYHAPHYSGLRLLLQRPRIGQWSASLAQRYNLVLDLLLRPYCRGGNTSSSSGSSMATTTTASGGGGGSGGSPKRTRRRLLMRPSDPPAQPPAEHPPPAAARTEELREIEKAIRRHGGTAAFLTQAAQLLDPQEHVAWAGRWDLSAVVYDITARAGITWDCVGSREDVWQGPQLALAAERLAAEPTVQTTWMAEDAGGGGHLWTVSQAPFVAQRVRALVARARQSLQDEDESHPQQQQQQQQQQQHDDDGLTPPTSWVAPPPVSI